MNVIEIQYWFTREVLPLEPGLTRFLRRSWRNQSEIADLRQEIYVRLCDAARSRKPKQIKPFLFAVARNLIIDLARRAPAARLHVAADEGSVDSADLNTPDHEVIARENLQILQHALNQLPNRCREVVHLRRLEGLSQRETAARMGITENTVERQMVKAMQRLAYALSQEQPNGARRPSDSRAKTAEPQDALIKAALSSVMIQGPSLERLG